MKTDVNTIDVCGKLWNSLGLKSRKQKILPDNQLYPNKRQSPTITTNEMCLRNPKTIKNSIERYGTEWTTNTEKTNGYHLRLAVVVLRMKGGNETQQAPVLDFSSLATHANRFFPRLFHHIAYQSSTLS
mmetsp:Transcript_26111/g.60061  ORF Transcript_26111/g.60061 Transcript_26111/m.60061 type:complete len:129 (+) Transcript_26111:518-904(+)